MRSIYSLCLQNASLAMDCRLTCAIVGNFELGFAIANTASCTSTQGWAVEGLL